MRKHLGRPAVAITAGTLGLVIAGCAAHSTGGANGSGGTAPGAPSRVDSAHAPEQFGTVNGTAGTAAGPSVPAPATRSVALSSTALAGHDLVLTATVSVRVADVAAVTRRTEQLVVSAHGFVASERLQTDPAHSSDDTATMSLRVPESAYDSTIKAVEALGVRIAEQRNVDDVTDQVVDTTSRVATAKAGLTRVRTLLDRATSLGQVIDLESELSKREADLESMERRLATLQRQVALATIDVTFGHSAAVAHTHHSQSGFVGGIVGGWHAFTRAGNGLLTAVGAVLPFLFVLVAVAGAVALVRRRRVHPSANG